MLIRNFIFKLGILTSSISYGFVDLDTYSPSERSTRLNSFTVPVAVHDALYQTLKDVMDVLTDHKIPAQAGYGTCLALRRHQVSVKSEKLSGIIPHDDDIDLVIHEDFVEALQSCSPIFKDLGFLTQEDGNLLYDEKLGRYVLQKKVGFSVTYQEKTADYYPFIDIFVFKNDPTDSTKVILANDHARENTFLKKYWYTSEEFLNSAVYNFSSIPLVAPQKADDFLKRSYGSDCLNVCYFKSNHILTHQDTLYKWTPTEEEKRPYLNHNLENRYLELQKKYYWDHFYKTTSVIEQPSSFALFITPHLCKGETLLEVGCGNGRDSLYFSTLGTTVTAIDISHEAVSQNNKKSKELCLSAKFQVTDVKSPQSLSELGTYNHIYTRFFLHALTPTERDIFMDYIQMQPSKTKIYFEFRTDKDPLLTLSRKISANEGYADDHYRCFINLENYLKDLKKINYEILTSVEENNLSIVKKEKYTDNPYLARIIAIKK